MKPWLNPSFRRLGKCSIEVLYGKQKFLHLHSKKIVIARIQCHFACSFWYPGLSKFLRERLQFTQNKIVRFVSLKLDPKFHVWPEELKSLGWLPVSKRVDQVILNHIFRIRSGTLHEYIGERLTLASSIHIYSKMDVRGLAQHHLPLQTVPYGMLFHQISTM